MSRPTPSFRPKPPVLYCPYCRYELSGVVSSWRDRCPLRGVCSECGTELDWPRVMAQGTAASHRPQPALTGFGCGLQTILIMAGIPVALLLGALLLGLAIELIDYLG